MTTQAPEKTASHGKAPSFHVSPMDPHNETLVSNVHPPTWANPKPEVRYNLVVIGAGTAGLVSAAGSAGLGAKVALIEKNLLGGDCLNMGCVPSKALIRSARAVADVRDAHQYGVRVSGAVTVDFPSVMERMRRLRAHISFHDSVQELQKNGVQVFLGEGHFIGRDALQVGDKVLRFSKAVIAAGARAADPKIPGLSEAGYLTNETVFNLTELPRRLAVIGGGPLGCELAQAFAGFGSKVTQIEVSSQVMGREDKDTAELVLRALERDGVTVLLNSHIKRVEKRGTEKIITVEQEGHEKELSVEEILVGVGRVPNVEGLDLEKAGVAFDQKHGVKVNDRLQTSNPRIYAAGDICSRFKFTHTAEAQGAIVIQNALFPLRKKASALTIPWCTYTDPEVAHVGMYEMEAREKGIPVETFTHKLNDVDRAILDGEENGFVRVHVRKGSDKIIGATIVARHAGEMISEITLAITAGVGLKAIASTIHPYPTQAESIKRAAGTYYRTKLTPTVKTIMKKWLEWTR